LNLNWIEKTFNNWVKIKLNSNLIIKKWDTNWWKLYSNLMNMVLKRELINKHKCKKTPFHASSLGDELNKFQFGILQCTKTYGT